MVNLRKGTSAGVCSRTEKGVSLWEESIGSMMLIQGRFQEEAAMLSE